jgi:hypothetical protein
VARRGEAPVAHVHVHLALLQVAPYGH